MMLLRLTGTMPAAAGAALLCCCCLLLPLLPQVADAWLGPDGLAAFLEQCSLGRVALPEAWRQQQGLEDAVAASRVRTCVRRSARLHLHVAKIAAWCKRVLGVAT